LDRIEEGSGSTMATQTLAIVRKIMNWHATRSDDYSSPVVRGMARTQRSEQARDRTLSDDEIRKVWAADNGVFSRYVRFLLLTAARRNEVSDMTWAEIDGGDWTLPAARNKTKVDLVRPLSRQAQAILDSLPKAGPFVFTTNGATPISNFSNFKRQLDKASGTKGWTLHDLRRTARSLMSRAGVPSDHAERCLGHVIGGIRGTYDQTNQELPELNLEEMAGRLRLASADQQEQQFVLVAELYGEEVAAELRVKLAKADTARRTEAQPKVIRLSAFAQDRADRLKRMAATTREEKRTNAQAQPKLDEPNPGEGKLTAADLLAHVRLVQITAKGWRVVTGIPDNVRFVRRAGFGALPIPVKGGSIQTLRPFYNVRDEDFVLCVGWLLGALRPKGPYSTIMLTGASGSAKTSGCLVFKRLIDPGLADLRPFKGEDDMYVGAYSSWVQGFDNISRISPENADIICRLATGIGYGKRALRTDAEQWLMKACRPIVLSGIPPDLADRTDLADRSIVLELMALGEDDQKFDDDFWNDFGAARPRILGALFDGMVGGLAHAKQTDISGYGRFRMMDFARFAEAGCRALGFAEGEFLTALSTNTERAMRLTFKHDVVAQAIKLLMEQRSKAWRGNTRPLMHVLHKAATNAKQDHLLQHKSWPKNDTWLGRQLRRSVPVLRKACEIEIEFGLDLREEGGEKDGFEIRKLAKRDRR
jgi:Phage integrase family